MSKTNNSHPYLNEISRPRRLMASVMSLMLSLVLFGAGCGGGGSPPPDNPDPEPLGCCQLEARCVQTDDRTACESREGTFSPSGTCVENQCR